MRIGKKLFSCLSLFLLCILCLLADAPKVWAAEFLTADNGTFLYMNSRELEICDEEDGVQFFRADDGTLQLMNKNTKDVYKTFVPSEQGMVGYRVRDVFMANPEKIFWEINATIGAHEQNCGYWLIGKENGQWVTYVTLEYLAKNGYAINKWRQIVTKINTDGSGRFILLSQYEYMPPEATFGMQRKYCTDLQLELLWDDAAQGFVMRRL